MGIHSNTQRHSIINGIVRLTGLDASANTELDAKPFGFFPHHFCTGIFRRTLPPKHSQIQTVHIVRERNKLYVLFTYLVRRYHVGRGM